VGSDRPRVIVKIELRVDVDQVHIGFEVGIERSDIPPIGILLAVLIFEGKRKDSSFVNIGRDDIFAKIMMALWVVRVRAELFKKEPRIEDVDPHRCQSVIGVTRDRLRICGFLLKTDDPLVGIYLHDTELFRVIAWYSQRSDG